MKNLPKQLMTQILWKFRLPQYATQAEFYEALKSYNEQVTNEAFILNLEEIALNVPQVSIQYVYFDEDGDDIEPDFLLTADNQQAFSQLELLYKTHNEVCSQLDKEDNSFFEGFQLWNGENMNYPNIPLYFLLQGS